MALEIPESRLEHLEEYHKRIHPLGGGREAAGQGPHHDESDVLQHEPIRLKCSQPDELRARSFPVKSRVNERGNE